LRWGCGSGARDVLTLHGTLEMSAECAWTTPGLQIRGVQGSSVRVEGGIWKIVADDTVIENVELIDTGIEMSGRNLTLRHVTIHGAGVGIGTSDAAAGQLTVEAAKLYGNSADVQVHTGVDQFRLLDSRIHSNAEGVSILAAAAVNVIEGNRIIASSNESSRADLVVSATSDNVVRGNLFLRPAESGQYPPVLYVISHGEGKSFDLTNNTFSNESDLAVKFVEVSGEGEVRATVRANIFWGSGAVDETLSVDAGSNYVGADDIFMADSEFRRNPAALAAEWGADLKDAGDVPTGTEAATSTHTKTGLKSAVTVTVAGMYLSKTSVAGAGMFGGNTVTLAAPAPTGGVTLSLTSSNPLVAVPYFPTVTIAAGQTVGYFYVKTLATTSLLTATIKATSPSLSYAYRNVSVGPVSLTGIAPERTLMGSGLLTVYNRINMSGPVAANTVVTLSSSSPLLTVPSSVTIVQGTSSIGFSIKAGYVTSPVSVTLTATHATGTKSVVITVTPVTVKSAASLYPSYKGGQAGYIRVYLTGPAGSAGLPLTLTTSNPAVFPLPASAIVPAGKSEILIATMTRAVTASTPVTFTATYQGAKVTGTLTIVP
jgi:hypothetical protein